jgi:tetratricopeptide (TPR) repeat protein
MSGEIPMNRGRRLPSCAAIALLLTLAWGCAGAPPEAPAPTPAPPPDAELTAFLARAEQLRQEERYAEGIELVRKRLEETPEPHPLVHFALGVLLGSDDDHRAAIEQFRISAEKDPTHYGSYHGLATAHTHLGELQESLPYLEKCLEMRPGDGDVLFQLGRSLSSLGRFEEAEDYLRRATSQRPDADTYIEMGTLYTRTQRLELAERAFRTALTKDPENQTAIFNLGQTWMRLGRRDEGQALLDEYERRATVNDRLEYYKRGARLQGATAGNFVQLADLQLRLGHDQEAFEAYRRALELDRDHAKAALGLASTLFKKGNLDEATKWAVYALALEQESTKTHLLLGVIRLRKGQVEVAEQAFARSRKYGAWTAETWVHVGDTYREVGDLRSAADAYREAARLKPDDARAQYSLAVVSFAEGRPEEALTHARRATELAPEYADAWMLVGIATFDAEAPGEAEGAFRKALASQRMDLLRDGGPDRIIGRFASVPGGAGALDFYRGLVADLG